MMLSLALVCDHALIDQAGKLSVLGIFERIWVERFPAVHPRLHLVLRLKGRRTEIGDHPVTIVLHDPSGREILRGDGMVQIGEPPAGVTEVEAAAILVFDVPLETAGAYHFNVTVDSELLASLPVTVSQMPAPHPTPEGN
ncbi:MAG: hypothetical protein A2085_03120 [Gemmatimonadetes bacterium GWC2_71_10]|nr:MAG: hypothetical protein A2085_03120 [Gemmatimonadetes bacterium GWC2_71_10]